MASKTKRVPNWLALTFKVFSIIAKVLFIPSLFLTVMIVSVVNDSKPLNNVENGVQSPEYKTVQNVKAGWGYYMIPLFENSGNEVIVYAQTTDTTKLEKDTEVVFYNIIDDSKQPYEFKIEKNKIVDVRENNGEVVYVVSGGEYEVPAHNIIGTTIEDIPAFFKFFIQNFSSLTSLMLAGVLPLVLILTVFVVDSTIYIKTKQGTVERPQALSREEQDNLQYFEQLKKAYGAPRATALENEKNEGDKLNQVVSTKSEPPAKPVAPKPPVAPKQPKPPMPPKKG